MSNIEKGDICIYHYADGNGSLALVEVTGVLCKTISRVKCLQVFIDNSGNKWFDYMLKTGVEMNAKNEYLHKLDTISRQQAENNKQKEEIERLQSTVQTLLNNSSRETAVYKYIKTQAVIGVVETLKGIVENELCLTENETDYLCMRIDDVAKEMVGDTNEQRKYG